MTSARRTALDPALSHKIDRYECSMVIAQPAASCAWHALHRTSRAVAIGLAAVAATIGGYLLQIGR